MLYIHTRKNTHKIQDVSDCIHSFPIFAIFPIKIISNFCKKNT